jgi:hypothetical protein
MLLVARMFASSEQAWEPMAFSSAKSWEKKSTAPLLSGQCSSVCLCHLSHINELHPRVGQFVALQCWNGIHSNTGKKVRHPKDMLFDLAMLVSSLVTAIEEVALRKEKSQRTHVLVSSPVTGLGRKKYIPSANSLSKNEHRA